MSCKVAIIPAYSKEQVTSAKDDLVRIEPAEHKPIVFVIAGRTT